MIKKLTKTLIATIIFIASTALINTTAQAAIGELTMINAMANIQVSGAVKKPGIYRIPQGTRLVDVLSKAGGLKKDAVLTDINLTTPVTDGSTIYIASKKDIQLAAKVSNIKEQNTIKSVETNNKTTAKKTKREKSETKTISNRSSEIVSLNKATAEDFNNLPGIGEKLAKNIVKYRNQHGRFKDIAELNNVPGIGDKKFLKLRSKVTL